MPFGTVTFTEVDSDGFLWLQVDGQGEGGGKDLAECCHPYGFLSRPHDPDADGKGCEVDERRLGHERFCWLAADPRSRVWLPQPSKGGSAQYGGPLAKSLTWREIDGTTGSIIDYVPVTWDANGLATEAHKLEMGVDGGGDPICQLIHSEGMCLMLFDGAATMADATGKAFVSCKDEKVTISGATKCAGGLDVGGTGGTEVALYAGVLAALEALSAGVTAAPIGSMDGGAALKGGLITACEAMSAALVAAKATMLKSL